MPNKTLTRNEKTRGWDTKSEPLPSEIAQKKVGVKPSTDDIKAQQTSAKQAKAKVK
ncbi:MAG: hypothetical protein ACI88H_000135 [Cocleimonas sp.]|jgi:hypothetical protein